MRSGGFSSWFIGHPVATSLITFGLIFLGLFAFPRLPVAPLPQAEFPTLQISANLPGADPETMASAVATPLEVQLSSVSGVTEMTSVSNLGQTSITLQFVLDKDIDSAVLEVQAAITSVTSRLPRDMPGPPSWRKVNPNDSPVLILRVGSSDLSGTELSDLVDTFLTRQLGQIFGVAEVFIIGQQKPAIRIQASPQKLRAAGVSMADIRTAIQAASVNMPKGVIYGSDRTSTLDTNDQLYGHEDYGDVVVASRGGVPVRVRDVAKVSDGAENDYVYATQNQTPGLTLIVRRQPTANIVETRDRVLAALPELERRLPASVKVEVLADRTRTIRSSLEEVELTLVLTMALVLAIMGLFLRQLSATLIVGSVLFVAIVSAFAAMYAMGFSLNNLTLVALVIAVGFVVDDAIVVIENIHRHLEEGMSAREAALAGAGEIGFTVASISLSLVAAFIPLLFMGGIVGVLFREFALTMSASILISVPVSLTLGPMLASRYMRSAPEEAKAGFMRRILSGYDRSLRWSLTHPKTTLFAFAIALVSAVLGYIYIPKGFFPTQDTAFIIGTTQGAQDASYADMVDKHRQIEAILAQEPSVTGFSSSVGGGGPGTNNSSGRFFISMTDRSDRDQSVTEFIDSLRPKVGKIPGVQLLLRAGQDLNLGGRGARTLYSYGLRSSDSELLTEWGEKFTRHLAKSPLLTDVSNDLLLGASVTRVTLDRTRAATFGITTQDLDQLLYDSFGQRSINEFQTDVNQYRVVLEIDERTRGHANSLELLAIRSPRTGELVPLPVIARIEPPQTGPVSISHAGIFPSINVAFNLAPGVSLGQAVELVEKARIEMGVPAEISGSFQGAAQAFQDSLDSQPRLILAALVAVYLILGVLYESFVHPLTILSTLPSAGVGALLMLWALGHDFSIMALIGVILLIGIVKKNGIMIVDFALSLQAEKGLSPQEAVHQACLVRLRPILMTTLAALLGAVPLAVGMGTGSELRQPLGVAVVGGLFLSQFLTLYTTPVIFMTLDRWAKRMSRKGV